jgi:hypothetical protein
MYYIYEIPGIKIGCSINPIRRQDHQLNKGEMIILEQHEDINVASQREIELQKEKGYKVDKSFYASHANRKSFKSEAGKIGGSVTTSLRAECPYCGKISTPPAIGSHKRTCDLGPKLGRRIYDNLSEVEKGKL